MQRRISSRTLNALEPRKEFIELFPRAVPLTKEVDARIDTELIKVPQNRGPKSVDSLASYFT